MFLGWMVLSVPCDDVLTLPRFNASQIRDLTLNSSHLNVLAMILFIGRHADDDARARCTFMAFPTYPHERQPGLSR